jgi:hypothetical protein
MFLSGKQVGAHRCAPWRVGRAPLSSPALLSPTGERREPKTAFHLGRGRGIGGLDLLMLVNQRVKKVGTHRYAPWRVGRAHIFSPTPPAGENRELNAPSHLGRGRGIGGLDLLMLVNQRVRKIGTNRCEPWRVGRAHIFSPTPLVG